MSVKYLALVPLSCGAYYALSRYFFRKGDEADAHVSVKPKKKRLPKDAETGESAASVVSESSTKSSEELHLEDDFLRTSVNLGAASSCSALALAAGYPLLSVDTTKVNNAQSRLTYTLAWEALSLLPLLSAAARVGYHRYLIRNKPASKPSKSASSLTASSSSQDRVYSRLLREQTEQCTLAIPSHILLASYLGPDSLHLIPILVSLFATGQILYTHEVLIAKGDKECDTAGSFGYGLMLSSSALAVLGCVGFFGSSLLE